MSLAIAFVGLLSITALVVVGGAAFVEMRPIIRTYREEHRRRRILYADETMRVYTPVRFARARQGDRTGAIASLLLSLLLLALGVWEWSRFGFSSEWSKVEGAVIATRADSGSGPQGRILLEYRYVVGEQPFTGYWVDTPEDLLAMVGGSNFTTRFAADAPLTVWFHPLMPTFPSLSRITLWYVVLVLGSGAFLLVSSLLTLLFARRQRAYGPQ